MCAAAGVSPRSAPRNTWLSCLLILEERYSQSCASSSLLEEDLAAQTVTTDTHHVSTHGVSGTYETQSGHTYALSQAIKDTQIHTHTHMRCYIQSKETYLAVSTSDNLHAATSDAFKRSCAVTFQPRSVSDRRTCSREKCQKDKCTDP